MTLPVVNPDDSENYLTPIQARKHVDTNGVSDADLISLIPNANDIPEEKKAVDADRQKDKEHSWNAKQVRLVAKCDECGAMRCIFSKRAVGLKNGPTQEDLEKLEGSLERGYICGGEILGGEYFYSRRALRCMDPIESQYYNPSTRTKGGRMFTVDICARCYGDQDLVDVNEIIAKYDLGGKTPLTICKYCFETNIDPPCSGGQKRNVAQAKGQQGKRKKKQCEEEVRSGHRKAHKC